jgi:hypothetical protein
MPLPQLTEPLGEGFGATVSVAECPYVHQDRDSLVILAGAFGGNQLVHVLPGARPLRGPKSAVGSQCGHGGFRG